jgi:AraC-like DNA-binding protein
MSDVTETGVLYTEHTDLRAAMPVASLWSYETRTRGAVRQPVLLNRDGNHEYWLERSDPLLNTILPGTGVSVVINFGDGWAAGRSLATSALLPRVSVIGPVTQPRILRMGKHVQAVGAVLPPVLTTGVLGVPTSEVIDRIVPLEDLWTRSEVDRLVESLLSREIRWRLCKLRGELVARIRQPGDGETIGPVATRLITLRGGRVSIDQMARSHNLSRKQFARRFSAAAGLNPKLFARITRFQSLVHALLSSDVSEWVSVAPAVGFYDQAHMINEFRAFAGSPPTEFFRPHGGGVDPVLIQLRGRPCEWVRRPGVGADVDGHAPGSAL